MTEFDVSSEGFTVNFGATGNNEIIQNVAMIIGSVVNSCPMHREFAWSSSLLDRPLQVVKSLLASRLIAAINKYEPRAQVINVTYKGSGASGLIQPTVRVRING